MAKPKKTIKIEEEISTVVEQNEPEAKTNAEVDNSLAGEATNAEINSVDGEKGEIQNPEAEGKAEGEAEGEIEETEGKTEEAKVNLTSWVASTVVNDPICGNRAVFQPQVSINNYQSTDTVARGENARRGEIIKRC